MSSFKVDGAMRELKPIETLYAGHRFRSRLEARWAVFFDALGVRWEYEPDAYGLPSGNYLPDFRIHLAAGPVWFEVKPPASPADRRWDELGEQSNSAFYVARGMPKLDYNDSVVLAEMDICKQWPYWDHYHAFCICRCGRIGIEFEGAAERVCGDRCAPNSNYEPSHPRLVAAYKRAHSARFEPRAQEMRP